MDNDVAPPSRRGPFLWTVVLSAMCLQVQAGPRASQAPHASALLEERVSGRGILIGPTAQPLDSYVNTILQRLIAADATTKPRKGVSLQAYVSPSADVNAYAHRDGAVIVTLGALHTSPSDDAVAFLLAHELSHIVNGDYGAGRRKRLSENAENLLGVLIIAGIATQSAEAANLLAALAANSALQDYRRRAWIPRWSRKQEERADSEAVRLLARAGFSAEGARQVLTRFHEMEQNVAPGQALPAPVTSPRDPVDAFIVECLRNAWNKMVASHPETHPAAAARLAKLQETFAAAYPNGDIAVSHDIVNLRSTVGLDALMLELALLEKLEIAWAGSPAPEADLDRLAATTLGRYGWGSYVIAQVWRRTRGEDHPRAIDALHRAAASENALLEARLALADVAYRRSGGFSRGSVEDLEAVKAEIERIQREFDHPYLALPYLTRAGVALSEARLKRPQEIEIWRDFGRGLWDVVKSKGLPDLFNQGKCIVRAPTDLVKKTCGDPRWLQQ